MSTMLPSDRADLKKILRKRAAGEPLTEKEENTEYAIYYMHPLDCYRVEEEIKKERENE